MTQFNPRSVRGNQCVLQIVREMGPHGSNVGTISDTLFERDLLEGLDRGTVYRRTLRSLKALMEEGLVQKTGLNYAAREAEIERGLSRKLAEAVANVAATSPEAVDAGLLQAALLGVAEDLGRSVRKARAPMIGKDLARKVLGE